MPWLVTLPTLASPLVVIVTVSLVTALPFVSLTRASAVEVAAPSAVIDDGVSGIVVDNYREMPAALERADALDPLDCRRYAEERYSPERMVEDYLRVYEAAAERASASL